MIDRAKLTAALTSLTARLVDDLRERTDTVDAVAAEVGGWYSQAKTAGRTDRAETDWREDLFHQVAVAWVLGCVFVRFCEDNELVDVPLISGPGRRRTIAGDYRAEFFAANRTAGDRAWLCHVFAQYAELPGTSELFGDANPVWLLGPSDDGARLLLEEFWRVDAETGELVHDFTDSELDTRFLGDCYQDLSEHAQKQYALLQTPGFVEEFILDRTLDPAVAEFGLEAVKMIDPTCGSGHFLLGAFDRLLEAWRNREPATPVRPLAQRVLQQVNGVDANPFAVGVTRFRLLVAALKACGIAQLADAPNFHPRVATGDSLIHGTRPKELFPTSKFDEGLKHFRYPYEDGEFADELLTADQYHAVVGNPPYITVKDPALNSAYRDRYSSCHRQYSMAVPFTERFFDLATHGSEAGGYVGVITANSFMKREFGKKLIEEHLPQYDLTHIIDTSGAYIPAHGTPTVILLARDREPSVGAIRAVLGIRGEPGRPEKPAQGRVWSSITFLVDQPGAENDFVSVLNIDRRSFASHPWSLQGGAALEVHEQIESMASMRLDRRLKFIGSTAYTRADEVFLAPVGVTKRFVEEDNSVVGFVIGEVVRDYSCTPSEEAVFPHRAIDDATPSVSDQRLYKRLWPHRTHLWTRREPNGTIAELGKKWFEWARFLADRHRAPRSITFPFVATHNHFVLDRGGKVFNRTAPMIKLAEGASEDDHLELLGLLNSSTACFWMKQVIHKKTQMGGGGGASEAPFTHQHEFDGTKLKQFPIPSEAPLGRARWLMGWPRTCRRGCRRRWWSKKGRGRRALIRRATRRQACGGGWWRSRRSWTGSATAFTGCLTRT